MGVMVESQIKSLRTVIRVFVVENRPAHRDDMIHQVRAISEDRKQRLGIIEFECQYADSTSAAKRMLRAALAEGRPFHVMILDLHLPEFPGSRDINPNNGLEVLRTATETGGARQTIATSAYQDDARLEAIRSGAVDFIQKDPMAGTENSKLQSAILRSWQRILEQDTGRLLDRRLRHLIPHAGRANVFRFGMCFSRTVQDVERSVKALRAELRERIDLDPLRDRADPLSSHLGEIEQAAQRGREEWTDLQTLVGWNPHPAPQKVMLTDAVARLVERCRPALITRDIQLDISGLDSVALMSFDEDVQTVFDEIVIGGLAEPFGYPDRRPELTISSDQRDGMVSVMVRDNLSNLSGEAAKRINEGYPVSPDSDFGRVWGLSVVQHVALRGGGRITVEPSFGGNRTIYQVPIYQAAG